MSRINIGDSAPDFTAPGTGKRSYALHEYKGKSVVLVFYPGDATPVCTQQLTMYTNDFSDFQDLDAVMLALSPQDVDSHERFQTEHNFAFPLLYDEDKRIGMTYGVVGPIGFYRRSVFVIDPEGVITFAYRGQAGLNYPHTRDIVAALRPASVN